MDIIEIHGEKIVPYLEEIGRLRIEVFQEWPYLYEGTMEEEKKYLQMYETSSDAIAILAFRKEEIVGAAIGLPLAETPIEMREVFHKHHLIIDRTYYLSDLLIQERHREEGLGQKLYHAFESAVWKLGHFEKIALIVVDRDDTDPRKPALYRPIEKFWSKLGFRKRSDLRYTLSYKGVDEANRSPHGMVYWEKSK